MVMGNNATTPVKNIFFMLATSLSSNRSIPENQRCVKPRTTRGPAKEGATACPVWARRACREKGTRDDRNDDPGGGGENHPCLQRHRVRRSGGRCGFREGFRGRSEQFLRWEVRLL